VRKKESFRRLAESSGVESADFKRGVILPILLGAKRTLKA
jgi:hypothetical protein